MAQSISQEAIAVTGQVGAQAASRYAGATISGAPTTGSFLLGDYVIDQSGSIWICTASSQTASATTASGNGNLITFTASNSFSPGQYVNVTGFSNTGYNVSNAVIGSASSTQFTVVSSATGTTTGTGTAVTTGTWQLSGVSVNENIAGKNFVINGGMDIWQRGTSFANLYNTYTEDRWQNYSGVTGITLSQVASGLTGFQYALRSQRNSGGTSTGTMYVGQSFESVNSIPFAGKTATFSFYARCGSNFSPTGSQITATLQYGTGTDNNIYSGFTGGTAIVTGATTLTTSWQRFTYTATFASTCTQIGFYFASVPTGTAGANDYFDITGVQLEIAPQATPFSRAGGSIGGELALCQRYFWTNNTAGDFFGQAWSTTAAFVVARLPATMRTTPSFTVTSLTNNINEPGIAGGFTPTGSWVGLNLSPYSAAIYNAGFSGLTSLYPVQWGNGYVQLSAEL